METTVTFESATTFPVTSNRGPTTFPASSARTGQRWPVTASDKQGVAEEGDAGHVDARDSASCADALGAGFGI